MIEAPRGACELVDFTLEPKRFMFFRGFRKVINVLNSGHVHR